MLADMPDGIATTQFRDGVHIKFFPVAASAWFWSAGLSFGLSGSVPLEGGCILHSTVYCFTPHSP
jgi:hypothetical protein